MTAAFSWPQAIHLRFLSNRSRLLDVVAGRNEGYVAKIGHDLDGCWGTDTVAMRKLNKIGESTPLCGTACFTFRYFGLASKNVIGDDTSNTLWLTRINIFAIQIYNVGLSLCCLSSLKEIKK